ncbi:MAG: right-handed parallel beta-helix repeat-containing protein, partial [Lachnospiraceae bacterium]|nr:right-handed parallel beta-helix repeat-containing protein [Lachnospiraceae bacterium]
MKKKKLSILMGGCLAVFSVVAAFAFSSTTAKADVTYDYTITSASDFNTFVSEAGTINSGYNLTTSQGTQNSGTSTTGADKNNDGTVAVRFSTNVSLDKPLVVSGANAVVTIDSGCTLTVTSSCQAIRVASTTGSLIINGGGTIDGSSKTATHLIDTSASSALTVSNITLQNASGRGMSVSGCSSVNITDVNVSGCGDHGIRLEKCAGTISGGTYSGNGANGIQLDTPGAITVSGSTVTGNTGYGLYATSSTSTVTVTNVTSTSNKGAAGIGLYDCSAISIFNGSSTGNTEHGYYISNSPGTINGATASSNSETGIIVSGSKDYTITGVTANSNTLNGISAVSGAALKMSSSTVSGNKNYGIQISDKASLSASNGESTKITVT